MTTPRHTPLFALVVMAVLAAGMPLAKATVNEALSFALEAATPYVKKGFSVRQDSWDGKMSAGKKQAIKHQLFKGNEYWFWLGSPTPGVKLSIKVYDKKGRPVHVETDSSGQMAKARVLAPKTGTYYIVIEAKPIDPKKKFKRNSVQWAVAYGFR